MSPDMRFQSPLVSKFINRVMWDGKKTKAQAIVYGAFDIIGKRLKEEPPLEVFKKALKNVQPKVEVRSRRIGGATYQVPVEVRPQRSIALGMRWIINYARSKQGKSTKEKLADEIIQAYRGEGAAVKKKEDTHRMAEANRAFAHYRW